MFHEEKAEEKMVQICVIFEKGMVPIQRVYYKYFATKSTISDPFAYLKLLNAQMGVFS